MSELPSGWITVKFSDLFDFKGGSQPPKEEFSSEPRDGYVRLLQIRDFEDDSKAVYIRDQKKWPKCAEHDIMIGRYGASVGKVLGGKAGAYNVALVRLIFNSSQVHHSWARYLCLSEHFQGPLANISRSAQNGFNKEDLKEIPIPFPPRKIQIELAHKLDSIFALSKSAREELGRVPKLVQRYKQAVLQRYFNNAVATEVPLGSLILDGPQNGLYLPKTAYGSGTPILRIEDFGFNETRSIKEWKRVKLPSDQIGRYDLKQGDIVINRVNSPSHLGKSLVISEDSIPAVFESNMMKIHLKKEVLPAYVQAFLSSEYGRARLIKNAKWAVNQASINQGDVRAVLIPMFQLSEQQRVADEITCLVASVASILRDNLAASDLLNRLDQATLSKAFSDG